MRLHTRIMRAVLLCATLASMGVHAYDTAREKQWSDQVVPALKSGQAEWLQAGEAKFLALYTEQRGRRDQGAVILLHDQGEHPDWPDVIHPLRTGLPQYGWSTLSVQLPVLPAGATLKQYVPLFDDADARVGAAVKYLQDKKVRNIVVVGYGLGASMGADYLARTPDSRVTAFVAIGMDGARGDERLDSVQALQKIKPPVLDIYGDGDRPEVLQAASRRAFLARNAAPDMRSPPAFSPDTRPFGRVRYRQVVITGADHYFDGQTDILLKRVRSWLEHQASADTKSPKK